MANSSPLVPPSHAVRQQCSIACFAEFLPCFSPQTCCLREVGQGRSGTRPTSPCVNFAMTPRSTISRQSKGKVCATRSLTPESSGASPNAQARRAGSEQFLQVLGHQWFAVFLSSLSTPTSFQLAFSRVTCTSASVYRTDAQWIKQSGSECATCAAMKSLQFTKLRFSWKAQWERFSCQSPKEHP